MKMTILRAPDGTPGGGGTPTDWRSTLPEDIRSHASLKDIADIPTLAKSYVHAQQLVGAEKILKPQQNWGEKEWTAFYQQLGRPEKPEGYSFKVEKEKLPAGISLDDTRLNEAKLELHKLGLSDKQAAGALQYYLDRMIKEHTDISTSAENQRQQAITALKQEFGDNFDQKVNIAQAVVKKFGGPELQEVIDSIGNNPGFIKLFSAIGEAMMDDTARGGGDGLIVTDAAAALSEINQLKGNAEFQAALGDRMNPGHRGALERWTALHEKAYQSK